MRTRELKRMRSMVNQLSAAQRKVLAADLAALEIRPAVMDIVGNRPNACPHCSCDNTVKNGNARGLQRYKCRGCQRTFNALTGTPLARLHQRGRWLEHGKALSAGLTLREVSGLVGIAVCTAHRWRHRFLAAPQAVKSQLLSGIAEIDETYFLRSNKGQRTGLGRLPRHRGGKASKRGISHEQVPVLVARDRSGESTDFILAVDDSAHIVAALQPILPTDVILCTEGNPAMMATGRKLGIEHHPVNVAAGRRVDGPWHVQNVNAYHSRLKEWMRRFRGVATKYLGSYLGWFRTMDRSAATGLNPAQWLALSAST